MREDDIHFSDRRRHDSISFLKPWRIEREREREDRKIKFFPFSPSLTYVRLDRPLEERDFEDASIARTLVDEGRKEERKICLFRLFLGRAQSGGHCLNILLSGEKLKF